jgi:hypothetical protein
MPQSHSSQHAVVGAVNHKLLQHLQTCGKIQDSCSQFVSKISVGLFAAACCGCNPAAAAASTVFFSLWIAAAAVQTAATVSACSQPNTPRNAMQLSVSVSVQAACYHLPDGMGILYELQPAQAGLFSRRVSSIP